MLIASLQGNLRAQTFRAAASAGVPSGTTSLAISKPTGTTSRGVMIAAISVRPNTATITAPSGWTLTRRIDQRSGAANSQAIYQLVAGGSEPASYTWTLSGSPTGAAGGIMTFHGAGTTTPVNVENGQATASALTHATPSMTTTVNNTILATAHSFPSSADRIPPSGTTEAVDVSADTVSLAAGISLEMSYVTQASVGSSGTQTATASKDADSGVAEILALQAPAYSVSGTIFEDGSYGGGAGRSKASSSGVARSGARVEWYDASGNFSSSTTSDASGNCYFFVGLQAASYYVRVVSSSVTSSRTGCTSSCLAVQTYRMDACSGTVVAVTGYVGGTNLSVVDPGDGCGGITTNTITFDFSASLVGTAGPKQSPPLHEVAQGAGGGRKQGVG